MRPCFTRTSRVNGPTSRTDARHQGTISGIFLIKGFTVAPIFLFRSAAAGVDDRRARPERQRREQRHPAEGLRLRRHQRRRHGQGQGARRLRDLQLRPRRRADPDEPAGLARLPSGRHARIEAIGEIFNLFNAKNPAGFTTTRLLGTGAANVNFMQPRTTRATSSSPNSASARSASASASNAGL